mmetsp:Transcript_68807/g.215035  ORF Transcript_68807/g.215035 Transcript_68807/m.215035 type:complete len:223 (-) Transcript_68807:111-779(-)
MPGQREASARRLSKRDAWSPSWDAEVSQSKATLCGATDASAGTWGTKHAKCTWPKHSPTQAAGADGRAGGAAASEPSRFTSTAVSASNAKGTLPSWLLYQSLQRLGFWYVSGKTSISNTFPCAWEAAATLRPFSFSLYATSLAFFASTGTAGNHCSPRRNSNRHTAAPCGSGSFSFAAMSPGWHSLTTVSSSAVRCWPMAGAAQMLSAAFWILTGRLVASPK